MSVYLDTSGWSALYDANISRRRLEGTEILFSSCNLDEIGLAAVERARDLAKFAWAVSNRKKLLDHLELTGRELAKYHERKAFTEYDTGDPMFFRGWQALRTAGTPEVLRVQLQDHADSAKRLYREWLRGVRDRFTPGIDRLVGDELHVAWTQLLEELEEEGYIAEMVDRHLRAAGLREDSAQGVPYRQLRATACWVQYHLAIAFMAPYASGRVARPDYGDQVDFRHACYAGLADVFVSGDDRMRYVLDEMVIDKHATVLSPAEFLDSLRERQ